MHQLTSRFILLLLFTLSAVSALPTPNPNSKDVVRENPVTQGAIPKFVSKETENPGENGEEDADAQVKVRESEHKGEQEVEGEEDDVVSAVVELIVVNESDDGGIKQEAEIKAEKKFREGEEGEIGRAHV